MTEQEYQTLLAQAPKDHYSKEFQLFLINNNQVRFINYKWIVIENCKYKTKENDWLTAFYIGSYGLSDNEEGEALTELGRLLLDFPNREILIKAPSKRSIKLFHVHLYKV